MTLTTTDRAPVTFDQGAILQALGINAADPSAQALLLICQRYGLDPLLKHVVLIQSRAYITRDGLLHVAHRSEQLDGIEVLEQSEGETHHVAKVAVYRKDMGHPFTYVGRYPKNGSNKAYGPEMAVKCAEVMALRRAFDVAVAAQEEMWDQDMPAGEPDALLDAEAVKRFAITCREAGLDDDQRHALVAIATNGRTRSAKELRASERQLLLEWFHAVTEADSNYVFVGEGDEMAVVSRADMETPA